MKKIDMKKARCSWAGDHEHMIRYHDEEWGRAVHDDQVLFEFLILEGAQAGLSWDTVLRKRERYRKVFKNFDVKKVARMTAADEAKLMGDEGIIRNRLKIHSAVMNARAFIEVQKEFGSFDQFLWSFVGGKAVVRAVNGTGDFRATSPESDALSKALKKRGFNFVGSTIMYAYMQAVGLMVDHSVNCYRFYKPKK